MTVLINRDQYDKSFIGCSSYFRLWVESKFESIFPAHLFNIYVLFFFFFHNSLSSQFEQVSIYSLTC